MPPPPRTEPPPRLTEAQRHAFGIVGQVAFAMDRRRLVKAAKELRSLGLVTTGGAHMGQNRSTYHWELTDAGRALLVGMVRRGEYPLAGVTAAGRAVLEAAEAPAP